MPSPKPLRSLTRFPALRWIAGVPSGADRADLVHPAGVGPIDHADDADDVPTQPMRWDEAPAPRSCEHLIRAYAAHGGVLVGDRVVERLRQRRPQPLSVLGRWIVQREVVWFNHEDRLHLPMFQFDGGDMTVRRDVADVLEALRPFLDDDGVADWFVTPNGFCAGYRPIDWIEFFPLVVQRAAKLQCTVVPATSIPAAPAS